jgi:hypothetical protein
MTPRDGIASSLSGLHGCWGYSYVRSVIPDQVAAHESQLNCVSGPRARIRVLHLALRYLFWGTTIRPISGCGDCGNRSMGGSGCVLFDVCSLTYLKLPHRDVSWGTREGRSSSLHVTWLFRSRTPRRTSCWNCLGINAVAQKTPQ